MSTSGVLHHNLPSLPSNPNLITEEANEYNLNREIRFLLPEELVALPEYDVRPYKDGDAELEAKKIERLARSIEELGQRDDCEAVPFRGENGTECYAITIGNRRKRAIALINSKRTANAKPLLRVRVAIDRSGRDILKKAWHSNGQREQPTVMDLALLCIRKCEEERWDQNYSAWKKCAVFFGVDTASITQAMRIVKSDDPVVMRAVADGRISAASAFDLLTEPDPKVRAAALEKAEEIEAERRPDKVREVKRTDPATGKTVTDVEMPRVENPAVRKGLRKAQEEARGVTEPLPDGPETPFDGPEPATISTTGAPEASVSPVPPALAPRPLPLKRQEILEFFEEKDGPAYGHPDGAVRKFVNYFVAEYVAGRGNQKTADKLFDAMVKGADRGKEEKAVNHKAVTKTATGRNRRKDAKPVKAAKPAAVKKAAKKAAAKKAPKK